MALKDRKNLFRKKKNLGPALQNISWEVMYTDSIHNTSFSS
jgi:hypothetical protein